MNLHACNLVAGLTPTSKTIQNFTPDTPVSRTSVASLQAKSTHLTYKTGC